jgi:hypothetical protein
VEEKRALFAWTILGAEKPTAFLGEIFPCLLFKDEDLK